MSSVSIDTAAVLAAAQRLDAVGVALEELVQSLAAVMPDAGTGFQGTTTGPELTTASEVLVGLGARAVGVVQDVGAGLRSVAAAYNQLEAALAGAGSRPMATPSQGPVTGPDPVPPTSPDLLPAVPRGTARAV
jgi:hypothetical protein